MSLFRTTFSAMLLACAVGSGSASAQGAPPDPGAPPTPPAGDGSAAGSGAGSAAGSSSGSGAGSAAVPPAPPAAPVASPTPPPAPAAAPAPAPAPSTPVTPPAPDAEPSGAPNAQALSQMSLEDLLTVEVTAPSKKPELESEAPAVVQVITASEIEWLGFNSLEEVLEYAVGLSSINGEGNTFTTTTVRGNTLVNYQTNTLLLVDGVPIYSPYDGSFDFASIPLAAIQQIEIVKGSNSVLYGTNAISAVIDIRTKTKDTASFKLRLGRFNTMHSEAALSRKFGDVTASVFADTTSTTGEPLTYHDELGQTIELPKSSKTHAVIATLGYKGFSARVQQYERDNPSVKTRGFPTLTDPDGNVLVKPELNVED